MAKYFDGRANILMDIPKSKWYVLSNDKFMSGWGHAESKVNTCVVPCESHDQALQVIDYVESRGDQKYIRLVFNPPRAKQHVLYSLQLGWLKRGPGGR